MSSSLAAPVVPGGKQQPQCCARNVTGFQLELHSLLTGICRNTFSWVGQEGGKKIQRGHSGNNFKYRIMGVSSHFCFVSAWSQSQGIPEHQLQLSLCTESFWEKGCWGWISNKHPLDSDSGKRDLWFAFLTKSQAHPMHPQPKPHSNSTLVPALGRGKPAPSLCHQWKWIFHKHWLMALPSGLRFWRILCHFPRIWKENSICSLEGSCQVMSLSSSSYLKSPGLTFPNKDVSSKK